jgi:hypothetical protein
MELSPSREATSCAATQELLNISYNLKVRYRDHKSSALVPILSQSSPYHPILSLQADSKITAITLPNIIDLLMIMSAFCRIQTDLFLI